MREPSTKPSVTDLLDRTHRHSSCRWGLLAQNLIRVIKPLTYGTDTFNFHGLFCYSFKGGPEADPDVKMLANSIP